MSWWAGQPKRMGGNCAEAGVVRPKRGPRPASGQEQSQDPAPRKLAVSKEAAPCCLGAGSAHGRRQVKRCTMQVTRIARKAERERGRGAWREALTHPRGLV